MEFQKAAYAMAASLNLKPDGYREKITVEYQDYVTRAGNELAHLKKKAIALRACVDRYKTPSRFVRIGVGAIIIGFGLIDGIINYESIEYVSGLDKGMAIGASLLVGGAIGAINHLLAAPWIVKGKTSRQRTVRFLTVAAATGGIFILLATIRAEYQEALLAAEGIVADIAVVPFALVSIFISLLGLALSAYIHNAMMAGNATMERQDRGELKTTTTEVKRLEAEMEAKKTWYNREMKDSADNDEFSKAHFRMIETEAQQAYLKYLEDNAAFRSDGHVFKKEMAAPYPFRFDLGSQNQAMGLRPLLMPTVFLLGLGLGLAACSPSNNHGGNTKHISTLVDHTDVMKQYPTADGVIKFAGLDGNKYMGLTVEVRAITDVTNNPVERLELPPENELSSNSRIRGARVRKYTERLDSVFTGFMPHNKGEATRGHSVIYQNLVRSVRDMKEDGCTDCILLAFTDGLHNEDGLNFTSPRVQKLLRENPDSVQQTLLRRETIEDKLMENVRIYIIYESTSYENNRLVTTAGTFWERMFEKYGATVSVRARL